MTDVSLKSLFPDLAKQLDTTEGALYERMRALQRAGLIKAIPGKGPGKGVRATPRSMAVLLIGVLVTESLVETVPRTKMVMALKNEHGEKFADALAGFLASSEKARSVTGIDIIRTKGRLARGTIRYLGSTGDEEESFGDGELHIVSSPHVVGSSLNIRLDKLAEELK